MGIYATPFGYMVEEGKITTDSCNKAIVVFIFDLAATGKSLSTISGLVSEKYPGVTINKGKISRIIKDLRYTGNDVFPKIIESEIYEMANSKQAHMATRGAETGRAELLMIKVPYRCPLCHSRMRRFHDPRNKCPDRWACMNEYCSFQIRYADSDMISDLKAIITGLQGYEVNEENDVIRRGFTTAKLERDVKVSLDSQSFDIEKMREDILLLASMKYSDITETGIKKQVVKDAIQSIVDPKRYVELINQIGQEIQIEVDKNVTLVLKDGSRHRRTSGNGNCAVRQRENGNENCANESVG